MCAMEVVDDDGEKLEAMDVTSHASLFAYMYNLLIMILPRMEASRRRLGEMFSLSLRAVEPSSRGIEWTKYYNDKM